MLSVSEIYVKLSIFSWKEYENLSLYTLSWCLREGDLPHCQVCFTRFQRVSRFIKQPGSSASLGSHNTLELLEKNQVNYTCKSHLRCLIKKKKTFNFLKNSLSYETDLQ